MPVASLLARAGIKLARTEEAGIKLARTEEVGIKLVRTEEVGIKLARTEEVDIWHVPTSTWCQYHVLKCSDILCGYRGAVSVLRAIAYNIYLDALP